MCVRANVNISFQRAVDRYAGVPICALFSLLDRAGRPVSLAGPPRRILVILLSEMGSLVLAHAMFARLKDRSIPAHPFTRCVFAKNREVLDLLGVIPAENVLTVSDRSLTQFVADVFKVVRAMRALEFDVVIDCELFARVSSIFSFLSGAPVRVGILPAHTGRALPGDVHQSPGDVQPLHAPHTAVRRAGRGHRLRHDPSGQGRAPARTGTAAAAADSPTASWRRSSRGCTPSFPAITGKSLVLVSPSGGILPIRAWPIEHYRTLCDESPQRRPCRCRHRLE